MYAVVGARLSDRFGREPVMLTDVITAAVCTITILWLVDSGTVLGLTAAVVLGQALQGLILGPFGAFTAEHFLTPVRYRRITGQSASTFGAGFTPAIAAESLVIGGGNLTLLDSVWILAFVAAAAAIRLTKEGRTRDLAHIQ